MEVRAPGGQLAGEHAGLPEAPAAVRRGIAHDVAQPQAKRPQVAARVARQRAGVTGEHAAGRLVEVFRQIRHRRAGSSPWIGCVSASYGRRSETMCSGRPRCSSAASS